MILYEKDESDAFLLMMGDATDMTIRIDRCGAHSSLVLKLVTVSRA